MFKGVNKTLVLQKPDANLVSRFLQLFTKMFSSCGTATSTCQTGLCQVFYKMKKSWVLYPAFL